MKHEITLDLLEEIAFVIVDTGLNRDEAAQYAKDALLENYTPVTIEIKPGVWCEDIPNEPVYIEVCDSLIKLGFPKGEVLEYYEYICCGSLGITLLDGDIFHIVKSSGTSMDRNFTTKVSYLDIIAAANAMEG